MNPVAVLHELVLPTEGKLHLFLDGRGHNSAQTDGGGGGGERNNERYSVRGSVTGALAC